MEIKELFSVLMDLKKLEENDYEYLILGDSIEVYPKGSKDWRTHITFKSVKDMTDWIEENL